MSTLRVTHSDGMAILTLDRPDRYNALDLDLVLLLQRELVRCRSEADVHGVVITGAGAAFCAGGDLKWVGEHPDGYATAFSELAAQMNVCVTDIRRMGKPVVAAVNGVAAGGGFSLALACDFRVLAESAALRQRYTSNGLCIDAGGTFALVRLVGLARALQIAAFDEPIPAETALSWGLATRVVAADEVLDEALRMAGAIAAGTPHAFRWSKRLLDAAWTTSLETQMELERQGIVDCAADPEGAERVRAFLERSGR